MQQKFTSSEERNLKPSKASAVLLGKHLVLSLTVFKSMGYGQTNRQVAQVTVRRPVVQKVESSSPRSD